MALADLIPTMDDAQLKTLRENAVRIQDGDDPARQNAAAEILPVIDAELADRAAKNPKPAPKPRAKRKPAATAAAKPAKPAKPAKAPKAAAAPKVAKAPKTPAKPKKAAAGA